MLKLLTAAALLAATPALAQEAHDHGAHSEAVAVATGKDGTVTPDKAAATKEMIAINARMHKAMDVPMTGNLDADFVRGMIPHHQGAIELAELTLKQSNDPQIRALARGIVAAQKREITFMRSWLREKGIPER